METQRHIGIDLHRNNFTCCLRLENGRNYLSEWKLEDLPRFIKKLRPSDEIAVEVTGNTRLFRDAVARVVAVNPNPVKVPGALPRTPARGIPPESPGPLSLLPHVPERSSPSTAKLFCGSIRPTVGRP